MTYLDITITESFLTARVQNTNMQHWQKSRRLIKRLHGTVEHSLEILLFFPKNVKVEWHVDACHAARADCQRISGASMTLRKESAFWNIIKQKVNARSSAEAELAAANNCVSKFV